MAKLKKGDSKAKKQKKKKKHKYSQFVLAYYLGSSLTVAVKEHGTNNFFGKQCNFEQKSDYDRIEFSYELCFKIDI